jgi:hypothetical protein
VTSPSPRPNAPSWCGSGVKWLSKKKTWHSWEKPRMAAACRPPLQHEIMVAPPAKTSTLTGAYKPAEKPDGEAFLGPLIVASSTNLRLI